MVTSNPMTDRKANILARASRAKKASDKIKLHMLANEEKTIRDKPPEDERVK